jgi:hypothetical protein
VKLTLKLKQQTKSPAKLPGFPINSNQTKPNLMKLLYLSEFFPVRPLFLAKQGSKLRLQILHQCYQFLLGWALGWRGFANRALPTGANIFLLFQSKAQVTDLRQRGI